LPIDVSSSTGHIFSNNIQHFCYSAIPKSTGYSYEESYKINSLFAPFSSTTMYQKTPLTSHLDNKDNKRFFCCSLHALLVTDS
jgi:hypothetical protein